MVKEAIYETQQKRKQYECFGYQKNLVKQRVLLIWAAVFTVYGLVFYYIPLGGWVMAFQNYKPKTGLLHSKFVGLGKFQFLFEDQTFLKVIRNTLCMGILNLVCTFVMAILFAILLNEVRSRLAKRQFRQSHICRISFHGSL